MWRLVFLLTFLSGCSESPTTYSVVGPSITHENGFDNMQIVDVANTKAFIRWPIGAHSGAQKWVWFAPTFIGGSTPNQTQTGWYLDQLSAAGIAVVGVDVGESFGSPRGRDQFEAFYQVLQSMGFAQEGCMILQSRGGLMGYNWMMDHPGRVKCVAGIYPLLTITNYVGVANTAKAWGVDPNWLNSQLSTESPLERDQALLACNILHLHGDADGTVPIAADQQFVGQLANGQLTVIPGQGHEMYTPEFFHSQQMLDFIKGNL